MSAATTSPASTKSTTGLIYIFTGNGKGKTSAALGTAVRAVGHGWRVDWVAWYKNPEWKISEYQLRLPSLEMFALGQGFFIRQPEKTVGKVKIASVHTAKVVDTATESEHHQAAQAALEFAAQRLQSQPDVLVLDEICNAISDGLIQESAVLDLLAQRGKTHLVLTGRAASATLIEAADLVSEIVSRKHPYDQGKLATAGLDF